jgi:hypothetical protein
LLSGLIVRPSDVRVVVPPPVNPTRVLISIGSLGPKISAIFFCVSSLSTRCVFTRAIPSPDRPSTGPCQTSLRIVKRSSSGVTGAAASSAGGSADGGTASGEAATAGSPSDFFFMASSMAFGFMASIHELNASKVTTCSDLNQPPVHLRSTTLRYGACSTSLSRPALRRFSATLPTPHGATMSASARTATTTTIFFISPP